MFSKGVVRTAHKKISKHGLQIRHCQQLRTQKNDGQRGSYQSRNIIFPIVGCAIGAMTIGGVLFKNYYLSMKEDEEEDQTVMNWSGTHCATPSTYFQPSNAREVENLVSYCHRNNIKFRPMGSGISPNGLSFSDNAIMDMSSCNKVIDIDQDKLQITVEAGIKVRDVINAIVPYNMALENIPSIQEQQIGGLIQVSAHGTGIDIPPCDMQIVKMKIVTPEHGLLELTPEDELFHFARVGLGSIGVVTEVTIQCVERHKLAEYMWVMDAKELISKRNELMLKYKHLKWLWIPYTQNNKVVVIAADPINDAHAEAVVNATSSANAEVERQNVMRSLLCAKTGQSMDELGDHLSFADLRDLLLGIEEGKHVLDTDWVKEVNNAELEYWKASSKNEEPINIDWSENVLSFDCGGHQWVYEICFPIKRVAENGSTPIEIEYTTELLDRIRECDIAAPGPLEQRFSAASTSHLSPACLSEVDDAFDAFCWLGIIFYMPTHHEQKRRWITNEFQQYCRILEEVSDKYGAIGHWAKQEAHYLNKNERKKAQQRLKRRFGKTLHKYLEIRKQHDPNGILINDKLSDLFDL